LSGSVSRESTDLELIRDEEADQLVGIRFPNLAIPQGASILSAQIEFIVDERGSELTMRAEARDDAAAFIEVDKDISDRPLSEAEVTWSEPARDNIGALQPTTDLTSLVQEIVDRGPPGRPATPWRSSSRVRASAPLFRSTSTAITNPDWSSPTP
jgi:MSHA biogenesis protein MshQ